MFITKGSLQKGYNEYIALDSPEGRLAMMDVGLLIMEAGDEYAFEEPEKETAVILLEGEATFEWHGKSVLASRPNPFDYDPLCIHGSRRTKITISAVRHSEFYVQKTVNEANFAPKMYAPADIQTKKAGNAGELGGTMRRNIRMIFDYESVPYSNMVLGEVMNFPGLWSSYPPHWHPQPEVYFYRYDKPQGFGVGFTNGKLFETRHNGLLLITDDCHSQVAAPGYALCYVWGIRHLPGNPWQKTRIDDPAHTWMLEKDAEIWHEKD